LQSRDLSFFIFSTYEKRHEATHEDFERNLGKLRYSVVNYERLVRATIPIPPIDCKNTFFLLMTLNIDSEPKTIIETKVLPIIEQNKEILNQ
jgi:hypothetical protein